MCALLWEVFCGVSFAQTLWRTAAVHGTAAVRREVNELALKSRVNVPLWVSHREAVGPLGRAWRISGDPESPQGGAPPPQ